MITAHQETTVATPPPPPPPREPGPSGPYGQHGPYGPAPGPQGPYADPRARGPYAPPQAPPGPYGPYGPPGPAGPQPGGYVHPYSPGTVGCRVCGAVPAAPATVRGHQGLIVLMRFLSAPGPFCRDCGTSTYRRMSADTLWQGWWGPLSLFITPVTLLVNLGPRAAFRRLGPPVGGFRPPLDPGRPLWRRPAALLFLLPAVLLPLAVAALLVIGLVAGGEERGASTLTVGQCVRNAGDWHDQDLRVVPCGAASAELRVTRLLEPGATCADGEFYADLKYGPGGVRTNCLAPVR
ncbi:hypothetical protein ABT143_21345 [Streptomyces sp. NPDC002033]|uniref:LppU/SCO3897 family protein n=1 Tax=unclassified Streptomyces TaxID=2593676 RepID=UPI0033235340